MSVIPYTVGVNRILPSTVQFGGFAGEDCATKLVFQWDETFWESMEGDLADYHVLLEVINNSGEYDVYPLAYDSGKPTEPLLFDIPKEITELGGKVTMQLSIVELDDELRQKRKIFNYPIKLRFSPSTSGGVENAVEYERYHTGVLSAMVRAEQAARFAGKSGVYVGKEPPKDERVGVWIDTSEQTDATSLEKLKDFIDNTDVDYEFDSVTNANYTLIRIYKNKIDGTEQHPFVYAPNGVGSGTMTTYDLSNSEGWLFAINAGVFDMSNCTPDGILIQNGEVLQGTPTATHSQCKPLTIDKNGNLGSVAYDANATDLVNNGIVSAVAGFMPIIIDYEAVPSPEWNNVEHYTDNAQRQIIGQFGNGDYAIITCEGRGNDNSDGWTIEEAQSVCKKHGLKFAYNLDGGGSTETMLGLKHINTIYENTTGRKVPTFIVFNGSTVFGKPGEIIVPDEPEEPDTPVVPDEPDVPEYVIPVEYTEVEYIQTNGNQYIDTGIPEAELYSCEYKAVNEYFHAQAGHILSSANTYMPFVKKFEDHEDYTICSNYKGTEASLAMDSNVILEDASAPYTVQNIYDGEKCMAYVNGALRTTTAVGNTESVGNNYHFFAYGGNPGNTVYRFTGKLYYLKLWSLDGTLAHNYVPVKDSSGVYGLYDTVTKDFLISGDSTPFSGA